MIGAIEILAMLATGAAVLLEMVMFGAMLGTRRDTGLRASPVEVECGETTCTTIGLHYTAGVGD